MAKDADKASGNTKRLVGLPKNIRIGQRFRPTDGMLPPSPKEEKTKSPKDLDDPSTSAAIDDIVASEGNEVLAAEDAQDRQSALLKSKKKRKFSFRAVYKNKWLYISLPFIVIIALFAVPYTRYKILGLVLKSNYSFSVIDSTTRSAVGGATILVDGHTLTTSPNGQASVRLNLGKYNYSIEKHLYETDKGSFLVGLFSSKAIPIPLDATGRQIAIDITNKLTGQPVSGAAISVLDASTTTNAKGQADLVLPTKSEAYLATISANGFDKQATSISLIKKLNNFTLVPTGSLFFLVNKSGVINVEQTNLDGSDPQVLVSGSGDESPSTTSLMASPDWKYLLLESNRSGSQPELYIINTSTGQLTEFDSSPDQFNLIGWSGDNFIYDEIDQSEPTSVAGREQLKSYDATDSRLNILDQNQVDTGDGGYAFQAFSSFNLISSEVIYNTGWQTSGSYDTSTLTSTIRGVVVTGVNKDDFQSFPSPDTGVIAVVKNSPNSIYFDVPNTSTNQTTFYQYTSGSVAANSSLSAGSFTQTYPTYYFSPSGTQTLWSQTVNNVQETYIGDQNGQNQKQLAQSSGLSAFSWYDNLYVLLDKSNQLYIEPANGAYPPTLVGSYMPSAS